MNDTPTIIRVYTGHVKTLRYFNPETRETGYYEIPYKEFDAETGELVGEGTADFTGTRMYKELEKYLVWVCTDETNRAGGRKTEPKEWIYVSKNQKFPVVKAARIMCGENVARVKKY